MIRSTGSAALVAVLLPQSPVEIAFSPDGGVTELVVKTIESAKSSVRGRLQIHLQTIRTSPARSPSPQAQSAGVRNAENVIVLHDATVAQRYERQALGRIP